MRKVLAISLILIGALGLAYGGFSYTKETHKADVGPMQFSFKEKGHVYVPVWAGVAFILAGGLMLVIRRKF